VARRVRACACASMRLAASHGVRVPGGRPALAKGAANQRRAGGAEARVEPDANQMDNGSRRVAVIALVRRQRQAITKIASSRGTVAFSVPLARTAKPPHKPNLTRCGLVRWAAMDRQRPKSGRSLISQQAQQRRASTEHTCMRAECRCMHAACEAIYCCAAAAPTGI
jgi:hypothetical protein